MKRFVLVAALLTASVAQAQAVVIRSGKTINMLDVVTNGVDAGSGGLTNGLMCMGTDGTTARSLLVDTSGRFTMVGSKTNNAAAPGATNVGALVCIANAAAPSWTEGNLVGCSVDLAGNQRVNVAQMNGVATSMGNGVSGTGVQRVTIASDSTGALTCSGSKTSNAAAPGATNVGVLSAVATAAAPTYTEGYLVAASVDLSGAQRASLSTRIAGENLSGVRGDTTDWMEVYKAGTYTSAPTATTTTVPLNATPCTAVGGASCTIIYASTDWGAWPNITVSLRNSSANVLENVLVEWSPDGTNFELWDSTSLDNLAAGATASIAISGNSRRYLRLEARSDDAVVSAVVNITANQD